jgi:hypothetical protein
LWVDACVSEPEGSVTSAPLLSQVEEDFGFIWGPMRKFTHISMSDW